MVTTVGKKKGDPGISGPNDHAEVASLKVRKADQQIVAKIAAHRGLTIAELFQEQDVQTFFTHLLLEEMRKEAERLKKK